MADGKITKKALAESLKALMTETEFRKISIGSICDGCHMNRKSFYYHFEDKYDLVNWIYDTEFVEKMREKTFTDGYLFLYEMCSYFYENRYFYRQALKITGQNCFAEHFRERIIPVLTLRVKEVFKTGSDEFYVNFFADALICAIERWLLAKTVTPPQEFADNLRSLIEKTFKNDRDEAHTVQYLS